MKKKSFTLIELLVAVTLFLMAVVIAIEATVGSNNLINQAETHSAVLEGVRSTADLIRRSSTTASLSDISIDQANNILTIKKFAPDQSQNTCVQIGPAHYELNSQTGVENYNFTPGSTVTRETLGSKVFAMNNSGGCLSSSPPLYQGRLIGSSVEITDFQIALVDTNNCQSSCGLLRYGMTLRETGIKQSQSAVSRRSELQIVSSVPVGINR